MMTAGAYAEVLTPEEALARVSQTEGARNRVKTNAQPTLSYTAKTVKGDPAVYVFNQGNDNGFMMLSADDIAIGMLGYTDSGSFDPNNIPPQLQYWIEEYARQIEYGKANIPANVQLAMRSATADAPVDQANITPMVSTIWGQGSPFNGQTPVMSASHTPTGCVATALAQVMYYWKYPEIGEGEITYRSAAFGNISMSFDQQPFDWDNMIESYEGKYTTEQANAVAYLMKACGYATEMQYYASTAGTQCQLLGPALMNHFKYDKNIKSLDRILYPDSEWQKLIYDQLKIGPIIYSGSSITGAHCFVLDGYQDGYYHFNWGWSGLCNGYYKLSALNPTQQGTGGFYGGYNFSQSIMANVQKPTGQPAEENPLVITLNGTLNGRVSGQTLNVFNSTGGAFENDCMYTIRPLFALKVQKEGSDEVVEYMTMKYLGEPLTFAPGAYAQGTFNISGTLNGKLEDGRYKMTLVCRDASEPDNVWREINVKYGSYNYIYVIRDDKGFTVENMVPAKLKMTDAKIVSALYYNNPCQIEMTFVNEYDQEVTQSVVPRLYYQNRLNYTGDSQLVTLQPNETKTVVFNSTFQAESGATKPTTSGPVDFELRMIEHLQSGDLVYGTFGTYTMRRNSSNVRVQLKGMSITNSDERMQFEGVTGWVLGIDDPSNINLEVKVGTSNGFVATPLTATVSEFDPTLNQNVRLVLEQEFDKMLFIESGQEETATTVLSLDNFNPSVIYNVTVFYQLNGERQPLGAIKFAASSGVDEILGDGDGLVVTTEGDFVKVSSSSTIVALDVFDLGGKMLKGDISLNGNVAEINTINLPKGLYIVTAKDASGKVKSVKIMK